MPTAAATRRAPASSPAATRGRDRGDRQRASAERTGGERRHQRGIDAAGERDDHAPEPRGAPRARPRPPRRSRRSPPPRRPGPRPDRRTPPGARAARRQSSCSGARLTSTPSSRPTFTRTRSPPTSTVRLSRSSSRRRSAVVRTPRVPVSADRARHGRSRRADERRQHDPRPPLLHLDRRVHTSSAPAATAARRRPAPARAARRPGWSRSARPGRAACPSRASPTRARTTLGAGAARARRRSPPPRACMAGICPNALESATASAAPVGVTGLGAGLAAVQRGAAQQLEHGGRGQREVPVRGIDETAAERQRRAPTLRRQVLEREGHPAHLGHGVDRAHLVEAHLVGIDAMDRALRLGQPAKGLLRARRRRARAARLRPPSPGVESSGAAGRAPRHLHARRAERRGGSRAPPAARGPGPRARRARAHQPPDAPASISAASSMSPAAPPTQSR